MADLKIDATSASGSFDCTDAFRTKLDGAVLSGGRIKGSFEARS